MTPYGGPEPRVKLVAREIHNGGHRGLTLTQQKWVPRIQSTNNLKYLNIKYRVLNNQINLNVVCCC